MQDRLQKIRTFSLPLCVHVARNFEIGRHSGIKIRQGQPGKMSRDVCNHEVKNPRGGSGQWPVTLAHTAQYRKGTNPCQLDYSPSILASVVVRESLMALLS
ncbi:hypothetical protein BaRGS_00020832 [Batillaria attramentaria]|uniref:Uncharacterized protein n=1 Tax=Batillaria attramentaria TaxID=370345 RepID=A0ABD0KL14_9CAEN